MSIVHQGNAPAAVVFAAPQRRECGTANPSNVDIERMLRADRIRFNHFSNVASDLAASWAGMKSVSRASAPTAAPN